MSGGSSTTIVCTLLTIVLHYFHLATFFWMFVEGKEQNEAPKDVIMTCSLLFDDCEMITTNVLIPEFVREIIPGRTITTSLFSHIA